MNIKRIIAGISACVCVFGAMPVNGIVSWGNAPSTAGTSDAYADDSEVTFDMSQDNILRIQGHGIAKAEDLTIPKNAIKGVVVEEGITALDDDIFADCKSLKTAVFPKSLKTIGKAAFYDCENLEEITFSEGLVMIDDYAFTGCISLTELTFPDTIDVIGMGAFMDCTALEETDTDAYMTSIGREAFKNCKSLVKVIHDAKLVGRDVFKNTQWLNSLDNEYNDLVFDGSVIIKGLKTTPEYTTKKDYILYTIAGGAYEGNTVLENVTIGWDIKYICEEAFAGCTNLKTITIPNNVEIMEEGIFKGCTSLEKIRCFAGSAAESYAKTHEIPVELMESEVIEEGNLGDNASYVLYNDGRLVVTGEGEIAYDSKSIKMYEKPIVSVEIGEGISNVPSSLFFGCGNLRDLKLPDSLMTIDGGAFMGCFDLKSITLPPHLTSIGSMAFMGCIDLEDITFPSRISSIGGHAFYVTKWQDKQLAEKGYAAASGILVDMECEKDETVIVPSDIRIIGEEAFYRKELNALIIPYGVEKLCGKICAGSTVETITVPSSVTAIDELALAGCSELKMICGQSGSAIEKYAKEHDLPFTSTGGVIDPGTPVRKLGDIDGNGLVDASDASLVLVEYSKLSTGESGDFTEEQKKAADVDGDGFINANDASSILVYYSYLSTGGEIEDMAEWIKVK